MTVKLEPATKDRKEIRNTNAETGDKEDGRKRIRVT
jgi:hypothetical protein